MARVFGMIAENRRHVVVGLAGMDHRRLAGPAGDLELGLECPALGGPGRVIVMVVQAHLPGGDHRRILKPGLQPGG